MSPRTRTATTVPGNSGDDGKKDKKEKKEKGKKVKKEQGKIQNEELAGPNNAI